MKSATIYVLAALASISCLTGGAAVQQKTPAPQFARAWQRDIESDDARYVAAGQNAVLVAGSESGLSALALDDGRVLWHEERTSTIRPIAAGTSFVVATAEGLEALDQKTGQTAWRVPRAPDASLTLQSSQQLILGVDDKGIQAWRFDGTPAWQRALPAPASSRVASSEDALVLGLQNSELLAVDPTTGAVKWTAPLPAAITALTATGRELFAPGNDGALYAFRTDAGLKRVWKWRHRAVTAVGGAAIGERFVFYTLGDNTLRAFDRDGGSQRWSFPLASRPFAGPLLLGTDIVVPLINGEVVQVVAETGKARSEATKQAGKTALLTGDVAVFQGTVYTLVTSGSTVTTVVAWRLPG
jgi:outer membrane protein assembly factor BamB